MSFALPLSRLVVVLLVLGAVRPAGAQLAVLDPAAAKAVNACHKTATGAAGSYFASTYKSFKSCVDAVFICVQLKQFDAARMADLELRMWQKESVKRDVLAAKLRTAVEKKCNEGVVPFTTLRSPEGANLALLDDGCQRLFVGPVASLSAFEECTLRNARCKVEEAVEFAVPRAEALLASVGDELHSAFCPRPTPTPTPGRTKTPTKTKTPTLTRDVHPPPGVLTATPTPTPSITPTRRRRRRRRSASRRRSRRADGDARADRDGSDADRD
jgi:hypothetical protein